MRVFDDKTEGVIENNKYYIVPEVDEEDDVIFKTSYIVASDLKCFGNVTALFDLVVFGDIDVDEMDVKGKLICLGNCKVNGQLMVQNDIFAEDIESETIISHGQVVAQSMDVTSVSADGSIIIGRTLSVEEIAQIGEVLLCGETVFGSGKVVANSVLTVEPIDLDEGITAIIEPNHYKPCQSSTGLGKEELIEVGMKQFEGFNDYEGYISYLMGKVSVEERLILNDWLNILYQVDELLSGNIAQYKDGVLLIRFLDICYSPYFKHWSKLLEWKKNLETYFLNVLRCPKKGYKSVECASMDVGDLVLHTKYGKGCVIKVVRERTANYATVKFMLGEEKKFVIPDCFKFFKKLQELEENVSKQEGITCEVKNYKEWLEILIKFEQYRKEINETLFVEMFDALLANIGLKSKFILDRFREKGWN